MSINNAKHIIGEIEGVRCTIIESGIAPERAAFLTDLLEFNHFEVKKMVIPAGEEGEEPKFTIGVTDLVFNPVFAIYERSLKTVEGKIVTPSYWKNGFDDESAVKEI